MAGYYERTRRDERRAQGLDQVVRGPGDECAECARNTIWNAFAFCDSMTEVDVALATALSFIVRASERSWHYSQPISVRRRMTQSTLSFSVELQGRRQGCHARSPDRAQFSATIASAIAIKISAAE